jgi:PAS domain S-box-containing protein
MRASQHPIVESEFLPFIDAMGALVASTDFGSAARSIFEACRTLMHAESGYLAVLTEDGAAEVAYLSVAGATHAIPISARMAMHGLSREACRLGAALQCNQFRTSEWARLLPAGHPPIENVVCAPLVTEGHTVGVLTVANKPGGFSDDDARFAAAFARIAALALTRTRTLKALEQSEERFRTAAERAADAIIVVDAAGQVMSGNPAAERTFGWTATEIVGRNVTDLAPRRSRQRHLAALARARDGACSNGCPVKTTGMRKDGSEFPLELSLARLDTRDGIFFTAIMRDISDRHRSERERVFLAQASGRLSATLDSRKTLDGLVSLVVPTFADWCSLEVLEDAGLGRISKSTGTHPDPDREARLAEFRRAHPLALDGDGVFASVLRSGAPVLIPRVNREAIERVASGPSDGALLSALQATSFLAVPLHTGTRPIGVLAWFRLGERRPFDQRDVALARELGSRAVTALKNARLHETTERERARLRLLVEQRPDLRRPVRPLRAQVREALVCDETVGHSRAFGAALRQAQMVAGGDTTVLLLGETGTGKELLARVIHRSSRRASRQLVPVNCASIPETLVESELFGYEKGAFTGAIERRPGKFEAANGGTLFLDEIGDFPLSAQAKLLRVLQDGRVQRVGSTHLTQIDVRVIAATNSDLEAAVRDKRFRSDLYYRVGVFPIRLPPLRARVEDIRPMFLHFVGHFSQRLRRGISDVDEEVFERLERYCWPGNVRELQNVAERAVILAQGRTVDASSIILPLLGDAAVPAGGTFADAERRAIVDALRQAAGRVSGRGGAAHRLGLKATTLHAKMRKLGITRAAI